MAPFHVAIKPVIHQPPGHVVIVMLKMGEVGTNHISFLAVKRVKLLQLRVPITHHGLGPVISRSHPLGSWSKERGQLYVPCSYAQ